MSTTSYYWPGYYGNNYNPEYTQALTGQQRQKYQDNGKVQNALYNPKTGFIHVTSECPDTFDSSAWNNWPKIADYEAYKQLKVLNASGQKNDDQARFNYIMPEFQDQALRYYESYKARGAAVITSSEFPQITVTQISQALINKQSLVAQKYNTLGVPEKLTVTDTINVVFPQYNNTTETVRVGYKENEAIDTSGYGTITMTNVTLKKAGAGMAFTEEWYMRDTTVDIQSLLLEKIAIDFSKACYNRISTKLAGMSTLASAQSGGWSAYTAGNAASTNRSYIDIQAARNAINSADKLATADTIITNSNTYYNFYSNTWTRGVFTADTGISPDLNQIIANPAGIPWARQWIINEDVPDNQAYILDHHRLLNIEGPRKTQQINTYNPDQTIFIQKEWFEIQVPSTRSTWGRILTCI